MKYFKTINGNIPFAFENNPDTEDYEEITQEQYDSYFNTEHNQVSIAKKYLIDTSWIWEKYSRNVLVLENITKEDFHLKYKDIIVKQEEYRSLINTLENKQNDTKSIQ